MEDLAIIVSVMFFGSILVSLASIVLGAVALRRSAVRPFGWAVAGGTLIVGIWFATMNGPLAAAPLIGGGIGVLLLAIPLFKKR